MKRVMAILAAAWIFLAAGMRGAGEEAPAAAAEEAVREIAEVHTLEELESQEPVDAGDGWSVRLGWGDSGADGGPWVLLYCLAEYAGPGEPPAPAGRKGELTGRPLGPVFYTWAWDEAGLEHPAGQAALRSPRGVPKKALYCAGVPVAWEGTCKVRVASAAGAPLGGRDFVVKEPRAGYWQQFGRMRDKRGAGEVGFRSADRVTAARPVLPGLSPVFDFDATKFAKHQLPEKWGARDNWLPGAAPLHHDWTRLYVRKPFAARSEPLGLTLEDQAFVIRLDPDGDGKADGPANAALMLAWPDLCLLARWWVNGEPVVPPRSNGISQVPLSRAVTLGKEMTVAFGLPDNLGGLKAGDTIALQVMHAPWIEQLPRQRFDGSMQPSAAAGSHSDLNVPLLSNKFEFELTEELLLIAGHPAKEG